MKNALRKKLAKNGYRVVSGTMFSGVKGYIIVDDKTNCIIAGNSNGLNYMFSAEDVEEWAKENL